MSPIISVSPGATPSRRPSDAAACPDAASGDPRRRSASRGSASASALPASARSRPTRVLPVATASMKPAARQVVEQRRARRRTAGSRASRDEVVMSVARGELGMALALASAGATCASASARPRPITKRAATSSGTGSPTSRHARLDRGRDDRRRVGERAVPVEDEQPVASRRDQHRASAGGQAREEGGKVARQRRLEAHRLAGRRMRERQVAPRAGTCASGPRCASALFHAKSPYLSSPASGNPRCVRCTRIWCVRPVRSSASSKRQRRIVIAPDLQPAKRRDRLATRVVVDPHAALAVAASRTCAAAAAPCASRRATGRAPARRSACRSRRRAASGAARSAPARFLARSSTPDVSRSSRCTSSRNRASGRAARSARSGRGRCRCRHGPRVPPACRSRGSASSS